MMSVSPKVPQHCHLLRMHVVSNGKRMIANMQVKTEYAGSGRSIEFINQHKLEDSEGNLKADIRSFSNSKEWKIRSFKRGGGGILNWGDTGSAQKKNKTVFCCFTESIQIRNVKQAVGGLLEAQLYSYGSRGISAKICECGPKITV